MTEPLDDRANDTAAARDRYLAIDRVCDAFEREWRAGHRPAIESLLHDVPDEWRADLAAELIPLDVEFRVGAGERPREGEYRKRFPYVAASVFKIPDEPIVIRLPAVLGEYELTERLGGGGMGEVFLARHRRMDRLVAVKILAAGKPDRDEARQRFDRETRITAILSHPNVVTAYDAREDDGVRYLVTEYMPGGDLDQLVRTSGPLAVETAVSAVRQAALGLAHAHEQGIIHRDVKPGNLLRDANGVVRLADWGLARIQSDPAGPDADISLTDISSLIGTIDFLPPEQARRPDLVTPASDVYGLGCTLFFLLTGRPLFVGGDRLQRLAAHRSTQPPSLRELRPDVSVQLAECHGRMVAKNPEDRHRDMPELIAELDELLAPLQNSGTGLHPSLVSKPAMKRWRVLAAVVAMIGVIGELGWLFTRGRGGPSEIDPLAIPVEIQALPIADIAEYQRAWAKQCGVDVEMTDAKGIRLVFIPPGTFRMGSPKDVISRFIDPRVEPDQYQRKCVAKETERVVTIHQPFFLGRTEVTMAEFTAFVEETKLQTLTEQTSHGWGYDAASASWKRGEAFSWRDRGDFHPQPDHPVGNITWEDARKFCEWLSSSAPPGVRYRLPSESEWEFAARAGGSGLWAHGDNEEELNTYSIYGSFTMPNPVASRHPNAFGLFDTSGNMPEWCNTEDPWAVSRCPLYSRPSRGGRFNSKAGDVRVAAFQWLDPVLPDASFRVLREIPE